MLTRGIPYEDLCFYIVDVRTVFMKADFFAAKISCCNTLHLSRKTRCSNDKFLSLTKTSRFHNGFWLLSFKTSCQGPIALEFSIWAHFNTKDTASNKNKYSTTWDGSLQKTVRPVSKEWLRQLTSLYNYTYYTLIRIRFYFTFTDALHWPKIQEKLDLKDQDHSLKEKRNTRRH